MLAKNSEERQEQPQIIKDVNNSATPAQKELTVFISREFKSRQKDTKGKRERERRGENREDLCPHSW